MSYSYKVIIPGAKSQNSEYSNKIYLLPKYRDTELISKPQLSRGLKAMKAVRSELMFPCNGNFPAKDGKNSPPCRPLVAGGNEFKKDIG
jgi:hypothetical protein